MGWLDPFVKFTYFWSVDLLVCAMLGSLLASEADEQDWQGSESCCHSL
jgi:hypothetical protein